MVRLLGIDPTSVTFGAAGVWSLLALMIVTVIKAWPVLNKVRAESDGALRADLMRMIHDLRKELTTERLKCDSDIAALRLDNGRLHGQIHELRQQLALIMAAGPKEDRA
jgi:hypothetical protein